MALRWKDDDPLNKKAAPATPSRGLSGSNNTLKWKDDDPLATMRKEASIQPSGTTNAGFRQAEAAIKAPLTFGEWAGRGNPNNPTISKIAAAVSYPAAKLADLIIPQVAQDWATRAGQSGGEIMTMADNPNKATTGSKAGDITADLLGGLMGFGLNPAGGMNTGATAWKLGELAAEKAIPKLIPKAPSLVQEAVKIGAATVPFEATRAIANEREIDPAEMALAAGSNIALLGAGKLLGKGLGRLAKEPQADQDLSFIPGSEEWGKVKEAAYEPAPVDFTADMFGNIRKGEALAALPPGPQRLALPPGQQNRLALPAGKELKALPRPGEIPNFETIGRPRDSRFPQPKTFTGIMEELKPEVETLSTPPMESNKALVNYIFEGMDGQISKNEIRKMNYEQLASMAEDLAKERKSNLWDTSSKLAASKGYDLDNLYRMETDPAYAAERLRLAEAAGLPPEAARFKRSAPDDLAVIQEATGSKIGPIKFKGKAELAPEAMEKPEFQSAANIADKLGLRLVTYKGDGPRGIQQGRTIYLKDNVESPTDYVFWHEVGHSMEVTHPEHYDNLLQIASAHLADAKGMAEHYSRQGYKAGEIPDEFASDSFAEALATPGFFARVKEQSPELIKPLLEAIDQLITRVKAAISKDDSIAPYLQNLEVMRERIRQEVAEPYFKDAMGKKQFVEQYGNKWQDSAAKAKQTDPTDTPEFRQWFGDSKVVDEQGKPLVVYKGMYPYNWETGKEITSINRNSGFPSFAGEPDTKIAGFFGDIDTANMFAEKSGTENAVYPAYLSFQKPYIIDAKGGWAGDFQFGNSGKPFRDAIRSGEYDGIIIKNTKDEGTVYVALKPEQIKSVYNRGTWDATNPDIRFKLDQKSPLDDVKAMVEYGSTQLMKGGRSQFAKLLQAQFPESFAGYDKETADRLAAYVFERAKEYRQGGTVLRYPGGEMQIERGTQPGQDWNHVVSKTERNWPGLKQGAKNAAGSAYRGAIDNLDRLNQFDNLIKRTPNPNDRAYLLALNSREAGGTAKNIVERALVDTNGNEIGQSLASITKQIPKDAEDDFANYLIYRHSPSWLESGKQVFPKEQGITPDIARQRAAAYEQAHPEFKALADNLIQWQKDFKKAWLVDTGIIKPEEWAAMSKMYPDYVPLRRKFEDIEQGPLGGLKKGFANQGSPIKKAQGSQREIINPLESIIEDTDRIVKIARRNQVMQAIDRNIRQDPEAFSGWIEILPEKGETFESVLNKEGMEGFINWLEETPEQIRGRKGIKYDKANIIRGRINGETVHYEVKDQPLLDALTNITPQGANTVIEAARQVTRTMKILTTGSNPIFATRNIARDLPMAYIGSETLTKTPIAREIQFAWGILDSFARIATGGRYDPSGFYKTFRAMGGGSHSSAMAADRNLLAESKAKILPGYYDIKKPGRTLGRLAKGAGRGVEAFTNAGETIPRLPEYIRTAKAGGDTAASRQQGLYNAQNITVNFSKHGSVGKDADAVIPYLNAALQGMDRIAKIYTKDPAAAIQRSIIAISVPAITLWSINHDDPNYKKLSSYVRDNYFCIPMSNGKFLKIAKPREAGVVFGSLVERALSKWADDDPQGFKGFSEAWINNFAPPTRWIGAPMTDVAKNKNFADIPIVPGYMERLSPELQYDETTSAPAKALGKLANVSPKKLDYVARSYTGVLGELGIPAAAEGRGQTAPQRVGEVLSKTFTADPLYSNDIMNDFYTLKEKYDTANSDFKATGKRGEYYNKPRARTLNKAADNISELSKQIRKINQDKGVPYEAKEKRIRVLKQRQQNIAERAIKSTGGL